MTTFRRFQLHRTTDVNGVAGTGHVADGIVFSDGHAAIHWLSRRRTTTPHPDGIESVEEIHCYDNNTRIVWLDGVEEVIDEDLPCMHCIDGHPQGASRTWGVRVSPKRRPDGKPDYLIVQPSAGGHVANEDARWLWELIRNAQGLPS